MKSAKKTTTRKNQSVLLLSPVDSKKNNPTKILDKNLNLIKDFNSGFKFHFSIVEYKNFHSMLSEIFKEQGRFLVLGEPTDFAKKELKKGNPLVRRKKEKDGILPTIQNREGTEIILDLDDHKLKNFDPLNPEPSIKKWLFRKNINCDVTWQITASQKLLVSQSNQSSLDNQKKSVKARIRLFFELENPESLQNRKNWSQREKIAADGCVYTCSQPVYIAPPVIVDGDDPIKNRNGLIRGKRRKFKNEIFLSNLRKQKNRINNKNQSGYDFSIYSGKSGKSGKNRTLPKEVRSGKVYRRYFMPLAFHYVNKLGDDREAVFSIIAAKSSQVKNRDFDPENVYAYIDEAILKWKSERKEKNKAKKITDVFRKQERGKGGEGEKEKKIERRKKEEREEKLQVPSFPKNIMETWPEPWPMIWRNFKTIPRELTEELLVPTILSLNSFFLQSNFVTGMMRRPNMFFMNLTPSTGNKDINSKNVIEDLDLIFRKKGGIKNSPFTAIINSESSITSDTSFLQSFDSQENLLWVNTEATRIFHQLSTTNNSNVNALADKLIEVVDGRKISGKRKAGISGRVAQVDDPCAQILFYAQPETIERYITRETVDSGLFGRTMLSLIPDLKFDKNNFSIFLQDETGKKNVENEFYEFYMSKEFMFDKVKNDNKHILSLNKKNKQILHDWSKNFLFPMMQEDESLLKTLKRMGIAAEQLFCIIKGVCLAYEDFRNNNFSKPKSKPKNKNKEKVKDKDNKKPANKTTNKTKELDINCILPLLEYWSLTKAYAIKNYVNSTLDPLADEIYTIIKEFLIGKHSGRLHIKDREILEAKGFVPIGEFNRVLRNRPGLIRRLEANNEKRNAVSSAYRLIEILIRQGVFVSMEKRGKKYIGLAV